MRRDSITLSALETLAVDLCGKKEQNKQYVTLALLRVTYIYRFQHGFPRFAHLLSKQVGLLH